MLESVERIPLILSISVAMAHGSMLHLHDFMIITIALCLWMIPVLLHRNSKRSERAPASSQRLLVQQLPHSFLLWSYVDDKPATRKERGAEAERQVEVLVRVHQFFSHGSTRVEKFQTNTWMASGRAPPLNGYFVTLQVESCTAVEGPGRRLTEILPSVQIMNVNNVTDKMWIHLKTATCGADTLENLVIAMANRPTLLRVPLPLAKGLLGVTAMPTSLVTPSSYAVFCSRKPCSDTVRL